MVYRAPETRSPPAGGGEGEVDPRLVKPRTQDLVLDRVERALARADPEPEPPKESGSPEHAYLSDAAHRIGVGHPFQSQQIVRVDPEGEALRAPLHALHIGRREHLRALLEPGIGAKRGIIHEPRANVMHQELIEARGVPAARRF